MVEPYTIKIIKDFYVFEVNRKQKGKFLACMRDIFNPERVNAFKLFFYKRE